MSSLRLALKQSLAEAMGQQQQQKQKQVGDGLTSSLGNSSHTGNTMRNTSRASINLSRKKRGRIAIETPKQTNKQLQLQLVSTPTSKRPLDSISSSEDDKKKCRFTGSRNHDDSNRKEKKRNNNMIRSSTTMIELKSNGAGQQNRGVKKRKRRSYDSFVRPELENSEDSTYHVDGDDRDNRGACTSGKASEDTEKSEMQLSYFEPFSSDKKGSPNRTVVRPYIIDKTSRMLSSDAKVQDLTVKQTLVVSKRSTKNKGRVKNSSPLSVSSISSSFEHSGTTVLSSPVSNSRYDNQSSKDSSGSESISDVEECSKESGHGSSVASSSYSVAASVTSDLNMKNTKRSLKRKSSKDSSALGRSKFLSTNVATCSNIEVEQHAEANSHRKCHNAINRNGYKGKSHDSTPVDLTDGAITVCIENVDAKCEHYVAQMSYGCEVELGNDSRRAEYYGRSEQKKTQNHEDSKYNSAAMAIQAKWKKSLQLKDKIPRCQGRNDYAGSASVTSTWDRRLSSETTNNLEVPTTPKPHLQDGSKEKKLTTVKAPAQEVVNWILGMSKAKQRKYIVPGIRVKVRFVIKKKSQKGDSHIAPKLKWYGGVVVAVAEGGKEITIQYDDGTCEVSNFPDKEIVVDDTDNGRHRVHVTAFIPRELPIVRSLSLPSIRAHYASPEKGSVSTKHGVDTDNNDFDGIGTAFAMISSKNNSCWKDDIVHTVLNDADATKDDGVIFPRQSSGQDSPRCLLNEKKLSASSGDVNDTIGFETLDSQQEVISAVQDSDPSGHFATNTSTVSLPQRLVPDLPYEKVEGAHSLTRIKQADSYNPHFTSENKIDVSESAPEHTTENLQNSKADSCSLSSRPTLADEVAMHEYQFSSENKSRATKFDHSAISTICLKGRCVEQLNSVTLNDQSVCPNESDDSKNDLSMKADKNSLRFKLAETAIVVAPYLDHDNVANVTHSATSPDGAEHHQTRNEIGDRISLKDSHSTLIDYSDGKKVRKRKKADMSKSATSSLVKDRKRANEPECTSDGDSEVTEENWVNCDRCKKWRLIPKIVRVADLPDQWYCELNIYDLKRNYCDAPEQSSKQITKRGKKATKSELAKKNFPNESLAICRKAPALSCKKSSSGQVDNSSSGKSSIQAIPIESTMPATEGIAEILPTETTANTKVCRIETNRTFDVHDRSPDFCSNKWDSRLLITNVSCSRELFHPMGSCDGTASDSGSSSVPTSKQRSESKLHRRAKNGRRFREEEKRLPRFGGDKKSKESGQQEWVQCEKCEKWRRLPSRISAEDLPDVWVCSMNTWDPRSASCAVQEDYKTEIEHSAIRENTILGHGVSSVEKSGKLSFRNLIGGAGRRLSRLSERTRATESIFSSQPGVEDAAEIISSFPRVMYAGSCCFQQRVGSHHHSKIDLNLNGNYMSIFNILKYTSLWKVLLAHWNSEVSDHDVVLHDLCTNRHLSSDESRKSPPVIEEKEKSVAICFSSLRDQISTRGNNYDGDAASIFASRFVKPWKK